MIFKVSSTDKFVVSNILFGLYFLFLKLFNKVRQRSLIWPSIGLCLSLASKVDSSIKRT